jgi:Cu(I)/Ag(I) efflux system membrane protein CusA/SilA
MMETTIVLKPENEWRRVQRWYSWLPGFLQAPLRPIWRDRVSWEDIVNELDRKLQIPGVTNA